MGDIAIRVEKLSKLYRIGPRELYGALRDVLTNAMYIPFRLIASAIRAKQPVAGEPSPDNLLWALKKVSFEVKQGEVVGIIGRNGAGKTTLLKILSRITAPTEGYVEGRGRVGSLLEVGTGFHPELTGRENIYLSGAILGMKRNEIRHKLDEIVSFARVERFIDTPVKRYSSGMGTRLAFAVAAHLDSEIMLVDEVLAVADASFHKKCLGKMGDVAKQGRTVLVVSHNMSLINLLCSRAILLEAGQISCDGTPSSVVERYAMEGHGNSGERVWTCPSTAPGNNRVRLHAVRIVLDGKITGNIGVEKEVSVQVEFWNFVPGACISVSVHLLDAMGSVILCSVNCPSANPQVDEWFNRPHPTGLFRSTCTLPGNFLNDGRYGISVFVRTDTVNPEAAALEAVWFAVHDTAPLFHEYGGRWGGIVRPHLAWHTEFQMPLHHDSELIPLG